jgi:hypothetical protein
MCLFVHSAQFLQIENSEVTVWPKTNVSPLMPHVCEITRGTIALFHIHIAMHKPTTTVMKQFLGRLNATCAVDCGFIFMLLEWACLHDLSMAFQNNLVDIGSVTSVRCIKMEKNNNR